ncbi:MAG: AarF/ABC1/UbiB kinase family protein [Pseudomonadales bacterium]|nr:AarF/ABC1/UbiB kinase family protein [Pseudomonadales bacterium]
MAYGGDRYIKVVQGAFNIEKGYRKYRRKIARASSAEKLVHLSSLHRENAAIVCDICRKNGATWVKFAQFLSCRPDILPPEYIAALQGLQNSAAPILFSELKPTLDEAWGEGWEKLFSEFNIVPKATASVAQVHQARLVNGEDVAVKIRIPNVEERFKQDEVAFRSIATLVSPLVREFDIKRVTDQLISMTMDELDFETEANNMLMFAKLDHIDSISVPRFFHELSTDRILVTEWRGGQPLTEYLEKNPDNAKTVLGHILDSYMQQVMEFGIFHADAHPGNFVIDENQGVTILDFGALAILSESERKNYGALLMGLLGHASGDTMQGLFSQAGFTGADSKALDGLSDYIQKDRKYELSLSDNLSDVISKLRKNRVIIPDSFVSMARVLMTVGGLMKEYDVTFRWAMEPGNSSH